MFFFDPLFMIVMLPCIALAGWASLKVKTAIAHASRIAPSSGLTGAQAAARILEANGLTNVTIEPTRGYLGDHYDPRNKVLRLTPEIHQGRTLAAVGIAAHEAGHAIQDAQHYAPLKFRNGFVPLASIGGNLSMIMIVGGFFLNVMNFIVAGIFLFALTVVFQLINLPVEFNASSRARAVLVDNGIIMRSELAPVGKVLKAAAMTYVAATITAVVTLLYYLARFGLLGGRR